MNASWTEEQVQELDRAVELEIASRRADGTLRGWLPVWVVCVDDQVYVRTWYRRTTGWFGHAVESAAARVRLPGLETDVTVEDLGDGDLGLRAAVDRAYETKYGSHGGSSVIQMTSDTAAATTLRLSPA